MRDHGPGRNPLFRKRWFADEVIITCVCWYLGFRLSYRDLASIAAELGTAVSPSTILRGVVRFTREFVRRWLPFELVVGRSWRADDTAFSQYSCGAEVVTKQAAEPCIATDAFITSWLRISCWE